MKILLSFLAVAFISFLLTPTITSAKSCGDFIFPYDANYDEGNGEEVERREIVEDCVNPFNADSPVPFTYELTLAGQTVNDNSLVSVVEGESITGSYTLNQSSGFGLKDLSIFRKEGDDYRRIAYFYEEDFQLGSLQSGEYVAVFSFQELFMHVNATTSWLKRLKELFLPTVAQAFYEDFVEVVTVPFTVQYQASEPTGASSVLFLPGIMGSKLYEQGQQCDDFGKEQRRWHSLTDCEQLRLLTKFYGPSEHDIYTKAEDGAVIDEIVFANLYKSFMQNMNELEEDEIIADFVPFAYDWRLRLGDLLQTVKDPLTNEVRFDSTAKLEDSHLYQTVQAMVDNSHSGKVSIVAHSNGGLLAKRFMSALQSVDDPLAGKIDNIILVASPQVGTPSAIVSMLHGSEIGGGAVVSQEMSRILSNTAPFAHHLLPNQNYFDGSGVSMFTPVVSFKAGSSTNSWRDTFGPEITDNEKLHQFLSKESGRTKPATEDLLHPEVVDVALLNYAKTIANVLQTWTPNPGTQVYQIAGTGIETPSGITYFTDKECVKGDFLWFKCSQYVSKLGYDIDFTYDGDGTVVVPSALAMKEEDGVQRLWLDLNSFNELNSDRVHKNIFEVPEIIDFIKSTIQSTSTSATPRYLSSTRINPDIGNRLSFILHSPLDMYVESSAGVTSSSTDEIPGVTYRRYGEVQYVFMPADTSGLTLQLRGYQAGSFTLVVKEWDGEILLGTRDFEAIPTGTSTIVQLTLDLFDVDTSLEIDIDGDGTIDGIVSAETDTVTPIANFLSEDTQTDVKVEELRASSQATATRLNRTPQSLAPAGQVAGVTTSASEQWYYGELLKILEGVAELLALIEKQYEK